MTSTVPALLLHLILFFDVNKTIVAMDSAKGDGLDATLTKLYAEECVAVWEDGAPELSFYDYAHWKIPGPKSDQTTKRQRSELIQNFWERVKGNPSEPVLRERYSALRSKLNANDGLTFFDSFVRVIDQVETLEQSGIRCTLVFRTFGNDLPEVIQSLAKLRPEFKISSQGHFDGPNLILEGQRHEGWDAVWQAIQGAPGHLAIQDDWSYWNSHGEMAEYGKPFVIDPSDPNCIALFFDDNLFEEADPRLDIVHAVTKAGQELALAELRGKSLHRVRPLEAAEDADYFMRLIRQALSESTLADKAPQA